MGQAAALGVPPGGRVLAELAETVTELSEPGPFMVLSNGDAEANNLLVHAYGPADARLIDFEAAGLPMRRPMRCACMCPARAG
ncbi:hypothetical protein ACWD7Y_20970 [Streptomyces drozdowiczii]